MTDGVLTDEANISWFNSGHSTATTILSEDIDNDKISEITAVGFQNDGTADRGIITIFDYNGSFDYNDSFLREKETIWNESYLG